MLESRIITLPFLVGCHRPFFHSLTWGCRCIPLHTLRNELWEIDQPGSYLSNTLHQVHKLPRSNTQSSHMLKKIAVELYE